MLNIHTSNECFSVHINSIKACVQVRKHLWYINQIRIRIWILSFRDAYTLKIRWSSIGLNNVLWTAVVKFVKRYIFYRKGLDLDMWSQNQSSILYLNEIFRKSYWACKYGLGRNEKMIFLIQKALVLSIAEECMKHEVDLTTQVVHACFCHQYWLMGKNKFRITSSVNKMMQWGRENCKTKKCIGDFIYLHGSE